jgi:peptidoglycan hydrolase-like protein with peptidoglycan-binding domain
MLLTSEVKSRRRRFAIRSVIAAFLVCASLGSGFAARKAAPRQTPASKQRTRGTAKFRVTSGSRNTRKASKRSSRVRAQMVPTPARISEIQSALAAQGAYEGRPNGRWDDATVQAMKQYQAAHGLTPTGKLDALSLQRLGLGSQVAGRAAPLPAAPGPASGDSASQQQNP